MCELVGHSFVRSIRGPDGGYCLSRPAEEITFLEVVTAVEGPFHLTNYSGKLNGSTKRKCSVRPVCTNISAMRKVQGLLVQLLAGVSEAQLVENTVPETLVLKPSAKRKRGTVAKAGS